MAVDIGLSEVRVGKMSEDRPAAASPKAGGGDAGPAVTEKELSRFTTAFYSDLGDGLLNLVRCNCVCVCVSLCWCELSQSGCAECTTSPIRPLLGHRWTRAAVHAGHVVDSCIYGHVCECCAHLRS